MMASSFSDITQALVNLFQAEPPIAPAVYRARDRAVSKSIITAISVQWDGAMPEPGAIKGAPVHWKSRYSVECYARTNTETPDVAVDPLLVAVYARIAADTTLGGLVAYVGEPVIEAEYSVEGDRTGWVRMSYDIEHQTENSTLESR